MSSPRVDDNKFTMGNPMPESTSTLGWTLNLASDDSFGSQFVYDELKKDGVRMSSLMKRSAADKRRSKLSNKNKTC